MLLKAVMVLNMLLRKRALIVGYVAESEAMERVMSLIKPAVERAVCGEEIS
ncbi:MAG: hypothetical protein U0103_04490 [Candidatus Obscuribacterales bacterium]